MRLLLIKIVQLSIIAYSILIMISCNNIVDPGLSVYFPDSSRIEYYREVPASVAAQVDPLNLGSFNAKLWPKDKSVFYIKWYDGDDDIHTKVLGDLNAAFTPYTGKSFAVTADINQADFYISFIQNNQSWSYIGTDCKYIAATGKPTCNLGWAIAYRNNQGGERSGTAIHEIVGHALGYIHTLQSPACVGTLVWNKEFVYNKYAQIGWSRAQVDAQVFTTYSAQDVTDESCDFKSNMCYPVSAGEANVIVGRNNTQSALDIKKLTADYSGGIAPPPPPPPPVGNDLARGKAVVMSSAYGGYPGNNVTDGNVNTFCHTGAEAQPWVYVDLGSAQLIKSIKIYARVDCCNGRMRNIRVWVSNVPGTSYDEPGAVYTMNGYLQPNTSIAIDVPSLTGRYVRMQTSAIGGASYLHLGSVEVYGSSIVGPICRDTIYKVKYIAMKDSVGKVCN